MAMRAGAKRWGSLLRMQCRGMGYVPGPASSGAPLESLVPTKKERVRFGGKVYMGPVLGRLNRVKLDYKAKVKELCAGFRKEIEEKRIEQRKKAMEGREKKAVFLEQNRIIRWQRREERRMRAQEDQAALRVILENQRVTRLAKVQKRFALHAEAKRKKVEALREESCTWIEEKDLETRIHEAMVDPIRLIGLTERSSEHYESFAHAGASIKRSDDPLLRDDDDELMGAFSRKPRVSGQDILSSAARAGFKSKLPF